MWSRSAADIAIYGGAAGGGKSFALLLEPLRYLSVHLFGAVIFRRTYPRILAKGGLWEESMSIYPHAGGKPIQSRLTWQFPRHVTVKFAHLEYDTKLQDWHGSQIPLLCFDELTEFSERAFFYLLSRNRAGKCRGVKPYVRATCNPDAESWLAQFLEWWIDQDTGYAIPERSGVLRWMQRVGNEIVWGDSADELRQELTGALPHEDIRPKSVTFVPAKLEDNPWLLQNDPEYRSNLLALPQVERERLLEGNWKIKPLTGMLFPRDKWQFCDRVPADARFVRAWDKAGTEGGTGAQTAGVLMAEHKGRYYVVDCVTGRWNDIDRDRAIFATAEADRSRYGDVTIWIEREGGSGGKQSAMISVRQLAGHDVHTEAPTGDKATRWRPFAAQVQAGNVWIVRGGWDYGGYIEELDYLSGDKHADSRRLKDRADASALAFAKLALGVNTGLDDDILSSAGERGLTEEEMAEMEPWLRDIVESGRRDAGDWD